MPIEPYTLEELFESVVEGLEVHYDEGDPSVGISDAYFVDEQALSCDATGLLNYLIALECENVGHETVDVPGGKLYLGVSHAELVVTDDSGKEITGAQVRIRFNISQEWGS